MSKLLLFALLGLLAYLMLRGMGRPKGRGVPGQRPAEDMVACARCGLNLPATESLRSGKHGYCCEAHRVLGPRQEKN